MRKVVKFYSDVQNLSFCVGTKLRKVLGLVFCYNRGFDYSSLQEISLEFEGLKPIRFFCGVDGSSICWDNNDLQPLSMDEYGEVTICNISDSDELWKNLVDRKLEKVYLVTSEIDNCVFAVKLVWGYGWESVIANIGDDLAVEKQLSVKIVEEEKAEFLDIQKFLFGGLPLSSSD
jgi:hypothetical protein